MSDDRVAEWLTEEWTIRPDSALPSLWEIVGINVVDASITDALQTAVRALLRWGLALRRLRSWLPARHDRNPTAASSSAHSFDQRVEWRPSRFDRHGSSRWQSLRLAWVLVVQCGSRHGVAICTALVRYVMERYCLNMSLPCSYSLAESMFGLGRVKRANEDRSYEPLSAKDQAKLALWLALGPLCKDLLNTVPDPMQNSPRDQPHGIPLTLTTSWHNIQRVLGAAVAGGNVYCRWRYLLGNFSFTDVRNLLLQQVVIRRHHFASHTRSKPSESQHSTTDAPSPQVPVDTLNASALSQQSSRILVALFGAAVTFSWATQLLDWYQERIREQRQHLLQPSNGSSAGASAIANGASTVPPPMLLDTSDCRAALKLPKGSCPICSCRPAKNPVVCAPSGFVFCHLCILPHVRQHGTCPVTKSIVSESQLVRVYEPVDGPAMGQ